MPEAMRVYLRRKGNGDNRYRSNNRVANDGQRLKPPARLHQNKNHRAKVFAPGDQFFYSIELHHAGTADADFILQSRWHLREQRFWNFNFGTPA
jgi:hypothetical protein